MTCFNDHEMPYPCLDIVDNERNSHAKTLTLKVHPLVTGVFQACNKDARHSHLSHRM
ncbi:hypothetical protein HAX54_040452, partial [Datura stramonium]|nr:hypothetical protein [Datura stramonium]